MTIFPAPQAHTGLGQKHIVTESRLRNLPGAVVFYYSNTTGNRTLQLDGGNVYEAKKRGLCIADAQGKQELMRACIVVSCGTSS